MRNNKLVWSDGWWLEGDHAWFIAGDYNILFCADLRTYQCDAVACIPDPASPKFRQYSKCIKAKKDIYCLPDMGNSVWVYDTDSNNFFEIPCDNPQKVRLCLYDCWLCGDRIYAVSQGLKKVIEINPDQRKIEKYYTICEEDELLLSVKEEDEIYILSSAGDKIYAFHLAEKDIKVYQLPGVHKKLFAVCQNGGNFWLSGYKKEVFIWNKEKNSMRMIDNFPEGFGTYSLDEDTDGSIDCITTEYENPTFSYSAVIGEYAWFVPCLTSQILYIDKRTYEVRQFEIDEERENKESLWKKRFMTCRYLLEYVRDERYLGLFSFKKQCILEIDTLELKYEYKPYFYHVNERFAKDYIRLYGDAMDDRRVLDVELFKRFIRFKDDNQNDSEGKEYTGEAIYNKTIREQAYHRDD